MISLSVEVVIFFCSFCILNTKSNHKGYPQIIISPSTHFQYSSIVPLTNHKIKYLWQCFLNLQKLLLIMNESTVNCVVVCYTIHWIVNKYYIDIYLKSLFLQKNRTLEHSLKYSTNRSLLEEFHLTLRFQGPTVKNKIKEEDGFHSVGSRKQNLDHDRSLSMDD